MDSSPLLPITSKPADAPEQPKLPEREPFVGWVIVASFGLVIACVVGDDMHQAYATGRAHTQVEQIPLAVWVHGSKISVHDHYVSYADLPCTPNTTLYEAWGLPSGQCANTIPSSHDKKRDLLKLLYYSGCLWFIGLEYKTFCFKFLCFLGLIAQVLATLQLEDIYQERNAWV